MDYRFSYGDGNYDYQRKAEEDRYNAMVEEVKERLGVDDVPEYNILEDVANHGADAGFSGFIYTSECVEFYERHEQAIYDLLNEGSEEFGYSNPEEMISNFNRSDMLHDPDMRKHLLAWYALETVARREYENWEAPEDAAPDEDAYLLADSGPLGSRTNVSYEGKHFGEFPDDDSAIDAIRANMEDEKFFPEVWKVSDHGNYIGPLEV